MTAEFLLTLSIPVSVVILLYAPLAVRTWHDRRTSCRG